MKRDKQNIKTTDWLTRGMTKEELAKAKEEAIKEADAELRNKQIEEMVKDIYYSGEDFWCSCFATDISECNECPDKHSLSCKAHHIAKCLYNTGYRKADEVAREIFEEIEKETEIGRIMNACAIVSLDAIAELKKKYIGKDTNVTTKESEKYNGN